MTDGVETRVAREPRTAAAAHRTVAPLEPGDHIVVIGAGPAGLTTAYLAAKRGYRVTVLEGTDEIGGISKTAKYKGYRFDIGGHRFFTKIAPVQALWEEILGDDFIDVPRLSRIHYDGKYFDYPLKAWNVLSSLGPVNAARILASYVDAQLHPSATEDTFDAWVTNRFGRRLYELFFRTYTEKVWGIPCTEIRAEWAAQRIAGLSLARAILSAAALNRRSPGIRSLIDSFHYPRLGPGQMWEVCADRVRTMGGTVHMQHLASGIELCDGRATAVLARHGGGERRIEADHVVSTTDLRALVRALGERAPKAARDAAEGLAYRDFLVVALILDRDDVFPDNWLYIHTPGVKVGRIQNFNNWSAAMVPYAGRTCLGMEYFCFEGDELWESTDAELVALAARELEVLDLGVNRRHVVDGTVVRMPKAYPIYDGAYRAHLATVRSSIDPIANLHTVGRNGMHKYNNADHSMYTAMLSLENMLGARHDVWAVNTDFDYHEEQRVPERPGGGPRPTTPLSAAAVPSLPRAAARARAGSRT